MASKTSKNATTASGRDLTYTQNRELSWLQFDNRVLEEAYDESVPLFERMKFVSIFESNLDEFFMIRVGGLSDLARLKHQPVDNRSNLTPSEQIDLIFQTLPPYLESAANCFHDLETRLAEYGVVRFEPATLEEQDRVFVEDFFRRYVQPIISPLVIDPRHPFPNLRNGALYLVCTLQSADEEGLLGLIEIPAALPRVVQVPSEGESYHYILLEDIIMTCLEGCFGPYMPAERAIIRVIRNADIDPDGEGVAEEEDYRQHMKKVLKKRLRLQPVYLAVRGNLSHATLKFIRKVLKLDSRAVTVTDRPLDLGYVYSIESKLPASSKKDLLEVPFSPQASPLFQAGRSMREQVFEGDKLLFYPYESMNPLLDLVREASDDEECISIRITLYRVAKQSHLCESLILAAEHGKEVTVLMELRARFDEANNIEWAGRLEEAGCTVIYGSEGFKCHSKICQITYRTSRAIERITLLGTGNFNEKTAKLYSDFMLMTADPAIGMDGNAFFRNLSLGNLNGEYQYLGVAPQSLKPLVMKGLDREIERARRGEPARVFFKMNSLTDRDVIDKISEASCAGVEVQMIIRGISCLLPGVPGKTENVHIRSIVGRYLEHARVYAFGVEADTVYLSSADMMTRNTEHRVEIAYPVLDEECRKTVIGYMDAQLKDNVKARELGSDGLWHRIERGAGEEPFVAQEYLMELAIERAAEAERAEAKAAARRKTAAVRQATGKRAAESMANVGRAAKAAVGAAVAKRRAEPGEDLAEAETELEAVEAAEAAEVDGIAAEGAPAEGAAAPEPAPAPKAKGKGKDKPKGARAQAAPEEAEGEAPAPAPTAPAQDAPAEATRVQATLIEPEEPAKEEAPAAAPETQAAQRLATRPRSRVGTGFALIGAGLRTLIFGSKEN